MLDVAEVEHGLRLAQHLWMKGLGGGKTLTENDIALEAELEVAEASKVLDQLPDVLCLDVVDYLVHALDFAFFLRVAALPGLFGAVQTVVENVCVGFAALGWLSDSDEHEV